MIDTLTTSRIREALAPRGYHLAGANNGREWIEAPDREEERKARALAYVGRQGTVLVAFSEEGDIEDWQGTSDNAEADADIALATL